MNVRGTQKTPHNSVSSVLDEIFDNPGTRTYVMGVINVTPDSFSDGGLYFSEDAALAGAATLSEEGADILDIGAESSRPGAQPLTFEEERKRLFPLLDRIVERVAKPLSIDTYKTEVARMALGAGVSIVNDITALRGDPEMGELVANARCPVVLMHMLGAPATMQDNPVYRSVVDDLCSFFEERIAYAESLGINRIIVDPGIGFGKTLEHNLEIIRNLSKFRQFGRPVLIGVSRKTFIGKILGTPVHDRLEGTAAAVTVSIMNGVDIVRVHDVKEMVRVARVTDAILGRGRH